MAKQNWIYVNCLWAVVTFVSVLTVYSATTTPAATMERFIDLSTERSLKDGDTRRVEGIKRQVIDLGK